MHPAHQRYSGGFVSQWIIFPGGKIVTAALHTRDLERDHTQKF